MTEQVGDVAVVLGTRPEIIKLAPVIRALGKRARVIHTGQHWDEDMAGQFFRDLGVGEPYLKLSGMSGLSRGAQIATATLELLTHFEEDKPAAVIVQGDTNSTSAGAQAASYSGIPLVHVEAGLRSHDRAMPEELNRLVVGVLADLHCAATEENKQNLLRESVDPSTIQVTGNTVVEATIDALKRGKSPIRFNAESDTPKILSTIHRPENTDSKESLERILIALTKVDAEVIFAVHPRTSAAIKKFGLEKYLDELTITTGLGHGEFLDLAQDSSLIVSDSGGVQEEVTVLKKPLLVVRNSTERPESVASGFSKLVAPEEDLFEAITEVLTDTEKIEKLKSTPSPYGEGRTGEVIAKLTFDLVEHA